MLMIWEFAILPLLVLPIILLFRFAGCGFDAPGTAAAPASNPPPGSPMPPGPITPPDTTVPVRGTPPDYRKYILGEQPNPGDVFPRGVVVDGGAVIGYWRLVDTSTTIAKDEKSLRNGTYVTGTVFNNVNPATAPAGLGGSEEVKPPGGTILAGQPGLVDSDAGALCRDYKGGYVRIPHIAAAGQLHTGEFTIEAWVDVGAFKPNYEHVLFDAGGSYALPGSAATDRGYRIFADRNGSWQVRLASTQVVFTPPPTLPAVPPGKTHFAMVLKNHDTAGVQKDLTIYVDGKEVVTKLIPKYAPPDTAPLYIGAENTAAPTLAPQMRAPFLGRIQEVVLHKKALSREEIETHFDINRV